MISLGEVTYNDMLKVSDFFLVEFETLDLGEILGRVRRKVVACVNITDFRSRIASYGIEKSIIPNSCKVYALTTTANFMQKKDQINLFNFFFNGKCKDNTTVIYRVTDGERKFFNKDMRRDYYTALLNER